MPGTGAAVPDISKASASTQAADAAAAQPDAAGQPPSQQQEESGKPDQMPWRQSSDPAGSGSLSGDGGPAVPGSVPELIVSGPVLWRRSSPAAQRGPEEDGQSLQSNADVPAQMPPLTPLPPRQLVDFWADATQSQQQNHSRAQPALQALSELASAAGPEAASRNGVHHASGNGIAQGTVRQRSGNVHGSINAKGDSPGADARTSRASISMQRGHLRQQQRMLLDNCE